MRFAVVLAAFLIASLAALSDSASPTSAGSTAQGGTQTDGFVVGDFNCDNAVGMDDATIGLQVLATQDATVSGSVCQPNGDLDCDGRFTGVDILAIVRFVAELPLTFQGCPAVGAVQFVLSAECANLAQPLPIPDDGSGPATLTFDFPENEEILGLAICVNIEHPLVGDLVLTLKHEDTGTVVTLVNRVGNPPNSGNCTGHSQGLFLLFADSGEETLQEHCTNTATSEFVASSFKPDEPLGAFTGEDVHGTWTLSVTDAQSGNPGAVLGAVFTYIFQP